MAIFKGGKKGKVGHSTGEIYKEKGSHKLMNVGIPKGQPGASKSMKISYEKGQSKGQRGYGVRQGKGNTGCCPKG